MSDMQKTNQMRRLNFFIDKETEKLLKRIKEDRGFRSHAQVIRWAVKQASQFQSLERWIIDVSEAVGLAPPEIN